MAVNLNLPFKYRLEPALETSQYRRGDKQAAPKKIQRRFKVRLWHIILIGASITGLFTAAQQTYLYLIAWDQLTISQIEVVCEKLELKTASEEYLTSKNLGNILLLDIGRLRHALEAHPWVKEVHISKELPSRLKIVITDRIPAALLLSDSWYLIDREGVELTPINSSEEWPLPRFTDKNAFQSEREEKLRLAWRFIEEIPQTELEKVETIDLSLYNNVVVTFKDFPGRLKLGPGGFSEKMQTFRSEQSFLEGFGALEYVDLRIPERIYFKPQNTAGTANSAGVKESK
jgi:cell division septal protein FtsQ